MDMFFPALPAAARDLHVSPSAAMLTVTAYLVGVTIGQAVGPLSDVLGRRRPLLVGVVLFTVASLALRDGPVDRGARRGAARAGPRCRRRRRPLAGDHPRSLHRRRRRASLLDPDLHRRPVGRRLSHDRDAGPRVDELARHLRDPLRPRRSPAGRGRCSGCRSRFLPPAVGPGAFAPPAGRTAGSSGTGDSSATA